jgi:hypothetical protein
MASSSAEDAEAFNGSVAVEFELLTFACARYD